VARSFSLYGTGYYDPRTSVWQSVDPIIGEYMSGQTNGGVFNPKNLNMFGYTYNNPVNMVDPDGNSAKLIKSAYNILKKTYKNGGDFKKASTDEWLDVMDNVSELVDGDLTADDFFAAVDLLTGFGKEAKKATRLVKRAAKREAGIPTSRANIGKKRDPMLPTKSYKGKGQNDPRYQQEFHEGSNGKTQVLSRHSMDEKHKSAHMHVGPIQKDKSGDYKTFPNGSAKYDNAINSKDIK